MFILDCVQWLKDEIVTSFGFAYLDKIQMD